MKVGTIINGKGEQVPFEYKYCEDARIPEIMNCSHDFDWVASGTLKCKNCNAYTHIPVLGIHPVVHYVFKENLTREEFGMEFPMFKDLV